MTRQVSDGVRTVRYNLIRSRRTNVLLKVLPGGEIRVFAPQFAHLKEIDAIVTEKLGEIEAMRSAIDDRLRRNRLEHPVRAGSRICIEGADYALELRPGGRIQMKLDGEACILTLPDPDDEAAVRAALRQTLSRRALERIRQRLDHYAPRIGVEFGRVAIRDQKSRWGSCSSRHNLNFNWKLIMAPPEALDYVVIHELCHLIEFNHSPRFWKLVETQMPEYLLWKKWFKDHGGELGVGA